jgi:hypothetical protein
VTPTSAIPALSQQSNEAVTAMLRPLSTVALAASVWAAVLAAPVQAKDSDAAAAAPAVSASAVTARAQATAPAVRRVRKVSTQPRRVAAVATSAAYHPQCFLFWCTVGGRHFNLLMLGVAY